MVSTREAMQAVVDLLNKYQITSLNERHKIRERFTQDEIDEFESAIGVIDGSGEIG